MTRLERIFRYFGFGLTHDPIDANIARISDVLKEPADPRIHMAIRGALNPLVADPPDLVWKRTPFGTTIDWHGSGLQTMVDITRNNLPIWPCPEYYPGEPPCATSSSSSSPQPSRLPLPSSYSELLTQHRIPTLPT